MSEGLTQKQITIVRIITMMGGFLGALVILFGQQRFWGANYHGSIVSDVLIVIVGVACFINLIRHIRVWRRITKPDAKGND